MGAPAIKYDLGYFKIILNDDYILRYGLRYPVW